MSHSYGTRSAARRKNDQVKAILDKLQEYDYALTGVLTKEHLFDLATTAINCPDAFATWAEMRTAIHWIVYLTTVEPMYVHDPEMIALRDEFDTFIHDLANRSDYEEVDADRLEEMYDEMEELNEQIHQQQQQQQQQQH